jgi:Domain of unknown function (DUF4263)
MCTLSDIITSKMGEEESQQQDGAVAEYSTKSTSFVTAEISEVVLSRSDGKDGILSQKVLKSEVVENAERPEACLKITLAYQKKRSKSDGLEENGWKDLERIKLRDIKQGQSIEIDLDTSQTLQLRKRLEALYAVAEGGVRLGEHTRVVVTGSQAELHKALGGLDLSAYSQEDLADALAKLSPGLLETAAFAETHRRRVAAVEEFEAHMAADDWSEGEWEAFFRRNDWIFGHCLSYRFMSEVETQASLGGTSLDGKGTHRVDFVMASEAAVRFTALVDIKKPSTPLLHATKYRNKVYMVSGYVAGGVSQVQAYCRTWTIDGSQKEDNRDILEGQGVYTVQPKGILIIGNSAVLDDRDKRHSFEMFRQNLGSPEILTFDEILQRAKMQVAKDSEDQAVPETADDDW